jgi:hypothetical protein
VTRLRVLRSVSRLRIPDLRQSAGRDALERHCWSPIRLGLSISCPPIRRGCCNPKFLKISHLYKYNSAILRRWSWVRAPPSPRFLFDFESPQSRYGSHLAGGGAQFDEQFHTVGCCYLLLFFRVTLADLTFLTPDWCTLACFATFLARSETSRRLEKGGFLASFVAAVWRATLRRSFDYAVALLNNCPPCAASRAGVRTWHGRAIGQLAQGQFPDRPRDVPERDRSTRRLT